MSQGRHGFRKLHVAACGMLLAGCGINAVPDTTRIDEVLGQLKGMETTVHSLLMDPETGAIYSHGETRSWHPDTDAAEIRRFARSQGLNRMETEILLGRMEAQSDSVQTRTQEILLSGPDAERAESLRARADEGPPK